MTNNIINKLEDNFDNLSDNIDSLYLMQNKGTFS